MKEQYETERLILRILNDNDTDTLLRFLKDNKNTFERYEARRPDAFYTYDYQKQVIEAERKLFLSNRGARFWLFQKSDPDTFVGSVSFSHISGSDKPCSIGYKLAVCFQGKGYATEAASFLLSVIPYDCNIPKIIADIHPTNVPSQRLIERLGFKFQTVAFKSHEVRGVMEDHKRYVYFP